MIFDYKRFEIANYYGRLGVREENSKYFWAIENEAAETTWKPIPKYLYDALIKHFEDQKLAEKDFNQEF